MCITLKAKIPYETQLQTTWLLKKNQNKTKKLMTIKNSNSILGSCLFLFQIYLGYHFCTVGRMEHILLYFTVRTRKKNLRKKKKKKQRRREIKSILVGKRANMLNKRGKFVRESQRGGECVAVRE